MAFAPFRCLVALLTTATSCLDEATDILADPCPRVRWTDARKAKILNKRLNQLDALFIRLIDEAKNYDAERAMQEDNQREAETAREERQAATKKGKAKAQRTPPKTPLQIQLHRVAIDEAQKAVRDQYNLDPNTGRRVNPLTKHCDKLKVLRTKFQQFPCPPEDDTDAWLAYLPNVSYRKYCQALLTDLRNERRSLICARRHQCLSKQIHQARTHDLGALLRPLKANKCGATKLHSAQTSRGPNGTTISTPATTPISRMEATKAMLTKQLVGNSRFGIIGYGPI